MDGGPAGVGRGLGHDQLGCAHLLGDAADAVADVMHRRCVLGETPCSAGVAERLLCDADVTGSHLLRDDGWQPRVTHHRGPPRRRAALVVRDGGCSRVGATPCRTAGKRTSRTGAPVPQPPPRRPRGRLPAVANARGTRPRPGPRRRGRGRGGGGPSSGRQPGGGRPGGLPRRGSAGEGGRHHHVGAEAVGDEALAVGHLGEVGQAFGRWGGSRPVSASVITRGGARCG